MVADDTLWDGSSLRDVALSLQNDDVDLEPAQRRDADLAVVKELYDRWSPLVYSYALDCLGDVAGAEAVTRRVFVEAWNAAPTGVEASIRPSTWLIDLARATIADLDATPRSARTTPLGKNSSDGESKPARLTELLIADELSQQGPVREQVLRMALDERLTAAQIAERTQLPVDEVANHLTRALVALRNRLAVDDDPR